LFSWRATNQLIRGAADLVRPGAPREDKRCLRAGHPQTRSRDAIVRARKERAQACNAADMVHSTIKNADIEAAGGPGKGPAAQTDADCSGRLFQKKKNDQNAARGSTPSRSLRQKGRTCPTLAGREERADGWRSRSSFQAYFAESRWREDGRPGRRGLACRKSPRTNAAGILEGHGQG